jgi:hypothetical protein
MLGTDQASAIISGDEAVPEVCAENGSNTLQKANAQMWALATKCVIAARNTEEGKLIAGTYVHPDLIPSIAGWISCGRGLF